MIDREQLLTDISVCLERDAATAAQQQLQREAGGWELAVGYWSFIQANRGSDAVSALREFSEVLRRNEWGIGQIAVDSCAFEYKKELDSGEVSLRCVRGVGLWLLPIVEAG